MVLSSTMMWPIIQEDFTAIVRHDSNLMYVLSQLTPLAMHKRAVNMACSSPAQEAELKMLATKLQSYILEMNSTFPVRFEVLTAENVNITGFWDVRKLLPPSSG
jgi:hypothetical protein